MAKHVCPRRRCFIRTDEVDNKIAGMHSIGLNTNIYKQRCGFGRGNTKVV